MDQPLPLPNKSFLHFNCKPHFWHKGEISCNTYMVKGNVFNDYSLAVELGR